MNDEEKKEEQTEEKTDSEPETKEGDKEEAEGSNANGEEQEAKEESKQGKEDASPEQNEAESKEAPKTEEPKPQAKKEVKVSGKLADIIKNIEGLSVIELSSLVKALEEKFGVSAAAPVAVDAAPAAGEAAESAEEGQTTFNVVLTEGGANKISVIKAVRELVPTLGLKEAKDLVDGAPKQVLEGVGKDAANEAKQKLETAGGKVELK